MARCSCVRVFESLVCSFVCLLASLHSVRFGQLLRCAHKRIVNIMELYIERNNIQVELILFRKIPTLFTFTFARRECSRSALCLQPILKMTAIGHEQINNYPFARWKHPSLRTPKAYSQIA